MDRAAERRIIEKRLRNARARLSRAQRDVQDAEGELSWLDEQDSLEMIRSWRGVPDWHVLLQEEMPMPVYMLSSFFLEKMGLRRFGIWGDTHQASIHVGVAGKEDADQAADYVARIRAAIERIIPHIQPHDDGMLWFGVTGEGIDGFALELRVSPDLSKAKILHLHYGTVEEEQDFDGLSDALFWLQGTHPSGDAFECKRCSGPTFRRDQGGANLPDRMIGRTVCVYARPYA